MAIIGMMRTPRCDPSNQYSAAPTPLLFFFSFFFFSVLSSAFLSLMSFSVFPFLFRFVFSYCRFSVCFLYLVLRFSFRFHAFLGDGFCYAVISSWCCTSPRAPCEPEVCAFPLLAVFCLAFLVLNYFVFVLFLSFFRFRFGHNLFHPVFFLWVI